MNRSALASLALILAAVAAPAFAVNKCTDANGRTVYQDRPCQGAGKTIDIHPNSVDGTPNEKIVRELREYDKKIAARLKADEAQLAARSARWQAYRARCQGYVDEAERQAAWLTSISEAARASAAAEIDIARRKYRDEQCWNPNVPF